jgi:hypothetical protein
MKQETLPPYCPPPCTPVTPCADYKLECVVVCSDYSDFLRETLPHNKQMFDRIVVVTSPEDKATRKLCEFHNVQCVVTDVMETHWGRFCKGSGINKGLEALDKDGWVLHLDADIWLPPQTRLLLRNANLDKSRIYGIDRFIVKGFNAWRSFLDKPKLQQENECWVHLEAFPLGTRVVQNYAGGYMPVGFFQLWNPSTAGVYSYPAGHNTAAREDAMFAQHWPRSRRELLPEIVGYHLESEDSSMAANWAGRTTKEFRAYP